MPPRPCQVNVLFHSENFRVNSLFTSFLPRWETSAAMCMTDDHSWLLNFKKKKNYLAHTHFKYFAHQTKSAVLKFHCPQVVPILIFFCCWRFQLKDHKVPATLVSEFFQVFFLSTLRSFKIKLSVRLFLPGRLNCNAELVISSVYLFKRPSGPSSEEQLIRMAQHAQWKR